MSRCGHCPVCRIAVKNRRYERIPCNTTGAVGESPPPPPPSPPSAEAITCRHRVDELGPTDRTRLALDHVRRWFRCDHPDRPLGEAVCGCRGCGPQCRGYEVGGESE